MGQNQSYVRKHESAEICILSANVKICLFFVFIIYSCNVTSDDFCIFLLVFHVFFVILKSTIIVDIDKSCFLLFKASFLI